MTEKKRKSWRFYINALKRELPTKIPVRVRVKKMKHSGLCVNHGDYYEIQINKEISYDSRVDTLVHEYAHVLDSFERHEEAELHGASWGVEFARAYKVIEQVTHELESRRKKS